MVWGGGVGRTSWYRGVKYGAKLSVKVNHLNTEQRRKAHSLHISVDLLVYLFANIGVCVPTVSYCEKLNEDMISAN